VENDISFSHDGILAATTRKAKLAANRIGNVRFAVHVMYASDVQISGNASYGNEFAYALMNATGLVVRHNLSEGDRHQGIAINYVNGSLIERNVVRGGPERCLFIFNSNANGLSDNRFEGCETGVHVTAGSEGNRLTGNAFVGNRTQVKYAGSRLYDWSVAGRGNYWSDNPAFDLNGDGIADAAYRPNDLVDRVIWAVPLAKLLLNSPAVQIVRWAQSQFPTISPGGVVDTAPLMVPPPVPGGWRKEPLSQEGS
jgi:nitrous oxidase accessory protein